MALTVVLWVTDVLNAGITAVLALGLLIIAGVPSNVALSGFATGAFWILVSVLFFGTAMDKTGLARRISYRILLVFPPTYAGILIAFMLIGFVLTIGVPSMTVRTAIRVPIAFALVQAIELPLPSRGAALIVLGAFEMAVLPGCAVLTGSLFGPFIAGLFQNAGLPITWFEYARVMTLPTVIWCGLIVAANVAVLRPPPMADVSGQVVREQMDQLGPMRRGELMTAVIENGPDLETGLPTIAWRWKNPGSDHVPYVHNTDGNALDNARFFAHYQVRPVDTRRWACRPGLVGTVERAPGRNVWHLHWSLWWRLFNDWSSPEPRRSGLTAAAADERQRQDYDAPEATRCRASSLPSDDRSRARTTP